MPRNLKNGLSSPLLKRDRESLRMPIRPSHILHGRVTFVIVTLVQSSLREDLGKTPFGT